MKRPVAVTIVAVLAIIGGVLEVLGSLAYFGIGAFGLKGFAGPIAATATNMVLTVGIVMVILGILELAFGIGAFRLSHWAWTFGVTVFVLGLVVSVVQMFLFGFAAGVVLWAIVDVAVLGYLYTHDVRQAFGHLARSTSQSGHPTPA